MLVTRGAGFIGTHLADAFTARGDEVLVLDDLSSGRRAKLALALDRGERLIEGSVTDETTRHTLIPQLTRRRSSVGRALHS